MRQPSYVGSEPRLGANEIQDPLRILILLAGPDITAGLEPNVMLPYTIRLLP